MAQVVEVAVAAAASRTLKGQVQAQEVVRTVRSLSSLPWQVGLAVEEADRTFQYLVVAADHLPSPLVRHS